MEDQEIYALTSGTLAKLDGGRAGVALDSALRQAVKDCLDRPGDERARKVTMEFQVTPVMELIDNQVSCEGAKGVYKVRVKVPDRESGLLDFGVRNNGMLVFNENSPANHRQATFLGEDEE